MDPIQVLATPRRNSEAMREDLYAHFANDTLVHSVSRDLVAAVNSVRGRRPRRRRLTVAVAR